MSKESQPRRQPRRPSGSEPLSPSEHLRMLTELMRAMGPELGRRWLAALTLVPEHEREAVVEAVERQIVEEFGDQAPGFTPSADA